MRSMNDDEYCASSREFPTAKLNLRHPFGPTDKTKATDFLIGELSLLIPYDLHILISSLFHDI